MYIKTVSRYLGNIILIIGYYTILNSDMKLGIILRIIGPMFMIPSFIELKLWDVLFITGLFYAIDILKLLELINNK